MNKMSLILVTFVKEIVIDSLKSFLVNDFSPFFCDIFNRWNFTNFCDFFLEIFVDASRLMNQKYLEVKFEKLPNGVKIERIYPNQLEYLLIKD